VQAEQRRLEAIDGVLDAGAQLESDHCIYLDPSKFESVLLCVSICQRRQLMILGDVLAVDHLLFSDLILEKDYEEGVNAVAMCDISYEYQQVCGICVGCAAANVAAPTFIYPEGKTIASEFKPAAQCDVCQGQEEEPGYRDCALCVSQWCVRPACVAAIQDGSGGEQEGYLCVKCVSAHNALKKEAAQAEAEEEATAN
jgi:hypothetical protein